MTYPRVLSEQDTLDRVLAGASLARFGDGEFNLCRGGRAKAQRGDRALQRRLVGILRDSGSCLVGIPNLHSATPKRPFWQKYATASALLVARSYVSAFISRPDSAPWIDTSAYWSQLEALWRGRDVTLVRGSGTSLMSSDLVGALTVTEVIASSVNAWTDYRRLLSQIGAPDRAILCLGPTATVLAVDLCLKGVHAIDLGHAGLFLRKHRRGEPMVVTDADRQAVA